MATSRIFAERIAEMRIARSLWATAPNAAEQSATWARLQRAEAALRRAVAKPATPDKRRFRRPSGTPDIRFRTQGNGSGKAAKAARHAEKRAKVAALRAGVGY